MYIVGFIVIWLVLVWRIRKRETDISSETIWDILVISFFGGILGGRIGYFFLYGNEEIFLEFLIPWDWRTNMWVGWYGMSFFGALIGAIFFGFFAVLWKKISFFKVADFMVPVVPLGIFFGRMGNFFNGELLGRETDSFFRMWFDETMRHPSQIYEALSEGVVLFLILWSMRNRNFLPGTMLAFFAVGYGLIRFLMEFFREESVYIWGMTQGQVYALTLAFIGAVFLWYRFKIYDRMKK